MSIRKFRFLILLHLYILQFYFVLMSQQCFHQIRGISFDECRINCNNDNMCSFARYNRRFQLCELYDVLKSQEEQKPGLYIYNKPKNILNDNTEVGCSSGSNDMTCQRKTCPIPSIQGADMYGNMFDIGSKIEFVCKETTESITLVCTLDGTWKPNTSALSCPLLAGTACMNPGEIAFGKIGTLLDFNQTHARLNVTCNDGYSLYSISNILCEKTTGTWSGFTQACCKQFWKLGWTLAYASAKGLTTPIVNFDTSENDYCNTGLYRKETVMSNWDNLNIKRINFSIILDNDVVAYMLFKGDKSTIESWFSVNNLLESSWPDLQNSTSVNMFSVNGIHTDIGNRRWFVAKRIGSDPCTDIGWFVVTKRYYPCGDQENRGHRILYAKNGKASKFIEGEIGFADRFEIWVEM